MPAPSETAQQVSSEKRKAKEIIHQVFCTPHVIQKSCLWARSLVTVNNIKEQYMLSPHTVSCG